VRRLRRGATTRAYRKVVRGEDQGLMEDVGSVLTF